MAADSKSIKKLEAEIARVEAMAADESLHPIERDSWAQIAAIKRLALPRPTPLPAQNAPSSETRN